MKRRWSWQGRILTAGFILGVLSGTAAADIYRYVDPEGTVHYTNVPTNTGYEIYIREAAPANKQSSENYDRYIAEAVSKFDVPFSLIKAIIKVESGFDHRAVSHAGARGLMQIMPETGQDLSLRNPFDPRENILAGTRYFRSLLDRFNGSIRLALAAYNAGPERVEPLRDIPPIAETQRYVEKVLEHYLGN